MYVILTSKPGQFRTEANDAVRPVEAYDYLFHGQARAHFVIGELLRESKLRITDERPPEVTAVVPSRLLPKYPSIAAARAQLRQLAGPGMELRPAT